MHSSSIFVLRPKDKLVQIQLWLHGEKKYGKKIVELSHSEFVKRAKKIQVKCLLIQWFLSDSSCVRVSSFYLELLVPPQHNSFIKEYLEKRDKPLSQAINFFKNEGWKLQSKVDFLFFKIAVKTRVERASDLKWSYVRVQWIKGKWREIKFPSCS